MTVAALLFGVCALPAEESRRPLFLAHFMPWFQSKPVSGSWGWHWTMGKFDPDRIVNGQPEIASHDHPLIGAYDSADPDVLECQTLLMKLSGIDGIVIDWYGRDKLYDYPQNDRNAELIANAADRAGLRYAIIYEDHVLNDLVKNGKVPADGGIDDGRKTMAWLQNHWFNRRNYLRWHDRPVFLVFGPQYFKDGEFSTLFAGLRPAPAYFRLLDLKGPAVGGFGWPGPQPGEAKSWTELGAFYGRAKGWPATIGVAYPRFDDYYAQAGVHASWGSIGDQGGATMRRTMDEALEASPWAVQFATWNDWGEGTQIEPSVEYGYRDLEFIQSTRRRFAGGLPYSASDLRLPIRLFFARKRALGDAAAERKLDQVADLLRAGSPAAAKSMLAKY